MQRKLSRLKTGGVVIISLFSLLLPPTASSQITVTTIAAPVNTLTISDLDYLNATTPKWLFTITMSAPGTVQAVMTINLDVQLAAGTTYSNAAQFISKPFTINGTKTVTNLELGKEPPGIPQRTVDGYVFNPQAKAAFQDIALPSGSMPAGSYRFTVIVKEEGSGNSGDDDFTFVLTNPSSPVLISPAEGETIVEEFPLFEWQYDGPRSAIVIYEQLPGQQSLEETASGTPHLSETVSARSYRYPAAGARALKPGKTYVWYIAGLVGEAGGTNNELKSQLRSFTVSTARSTDLSWILQELESSLPPNWKPVFDQIRSQNLSPTGTIRLNGSPISIGDLLKVLGDIRTNPEAVSSVDFE